MAAAQEGGFVVGQLVLAKDPMDVSKWLWPGIVESRDSVAGRTASVSSRGKPKSTLIRVNFLGFAKNIWDLEPVCVENYEPGKVSSLQKQYDSDKYNQALDAAECYRRKNAPKSNDAKPKRLQQPPVYVNPNLNKVKMECDYNPVVAVKEEEEEDENESSGFELDEQGKRKNKEVDKKKNKTARGDKSLDVRTTINKEQPPSSSSSSHFYVPQESQESGSGQVDKVSGDKSVGIGGEEPFVKIPGDFVDAISGKLKQISIKTGAKVQFAIVGFDGSREEVKEAKKMMQEMITPTQKDSENCVSSSVQASGVNSASTFSSELEELPPDNLINQRREVDLKSEQLLKTILSQKSIYTRILKTQNVADLLKLRLVNKNWNKVVTEFLHKSSAQDKPVFFQLQMKSVAQLNLTVDDKNLEMLEKICTNPDLCTLEYLSLCHLFSGSEVLKVATIINFLLENVKNNLISLELRRNRLGLVCFKIPKFKKLQSLEFSDDGPEFLSLFGNFSRKLNSTDLIPIFPPKCNFSETFPSLHRIRWNLKCVAPATPPHSTKSVSLWSTIFPQKDQIFPNVRILEFSGSILPDDVEKLSKMFPKLKDLKFMDPFIEDFPQFSQQLWSHFKQLETLYFALDIKYEVFPGVDAGICGFSQEKCYELSKSGSLENLEAEEINKFRVNPSILDLKELKHLTITWDTDAVSANSNHVLTVVSGHGAFRLHKNLVVDLEISVPSGWNSTQLNEKKQSMEYLTPFVNQIKIGTLTLFGEFRVKEFGQNDPESDAESTDTGDNSGESSAELDEFHEDSREPEPEAESDESDESIGSPPPLLVHHQD